ncbi:acyltransferase family protein [Rhodococcus hoagii]|nr:acyltransferase family protein [Prescottella equi]
MPVHNQRLDIQGLRMVAVMLVVLSHLFHWPQGGFIGVDVFFVISGFLITGSLLHTMDKTGRISFSSFYRRRVRRIVPAATLVLVVTIVAARFVFTDNRFESTVWDAVAAFFFVSNWRFGIAGTDYFNASGPVSALQHYWSLSVEEQFYFVWPAIILTLGAIAAQKAWSKQTRIAFSASVMGIVALASFIYSTLDTASNPTWAYFSTLTRVWELGVGALLAITISWFERIPDTARPFIAWTGLALIAVGAFAINETGGGFPAPWAAAPVLGAALVICAGVAGEQKYLQVLTNRASTYIGDISYSLYLWHWPVIVLLAALMDRTTYYYAAALLLMFGCSIFAYHFFENPIRASKWLETKQESKERRILDFSRWRLRTLKVSESNQSIGIGALTLVTAGLIAIAIVPQAVTTTPPSPLATAELDAPDTLVGPAQAKLSADILAAVKAASWPELSPSMDDAIGSAQASPDVLSCGKVKRPSAASCTWGDPQAPKTMVILGDSIAMTYVEPLKNFAELSGGQWKVRTEAMFGCPFIDIESGKSDRDIDVACPGRKEEAIQVVNEVRPDVVLIANYYSALESNKLAAGLKSYISRFSSNVGKIALLAPPPDDVKIGECYTRASKPSDCISRVTANWLNRAATEKSVAASVGGIFLDPIPWFCTPDYYCPSFVGATPVKSDGAHMLPEYARLISPAFAESLYSSGLVQP